MTLDPIFDATAQGTTKPKLEIAFSRAATQFAFCESVNVSGELKQGAPNFWCGEGDRDVKRYPLMR
jgi:hypothetical protein